MEKATIAKFSNLKLQIFNSYLFNFSFWKNIDNLEGPTIAKFSTVNPRVEKVNSSFQFSSIYILKEL